MRRVSLPVRYGLGPSERRMWGEPTLSGAQVQPSPATPYAAGTPPKPFLARGRITPTDGLYPISDPDDGAYITLPERAPAGLLAVEGVEIIATEPDGTEILWRLLLGGNEYWHNGAAWVLAVNPADWNASAELPALFADLPLAAARAGLGFRALLRTSDPEQTPHLYAITMMWTVGLTETSIDGQRFGAQRSECLYGLIAALKSETFAGFEELKYPGLTISYKPGQGDQTRDVSEVTAVYNVTADPDMTAPLDGAWDPDEREFVLEDEQGADDVLHVEYRYRPLVTAGGDLDLVTDSLPAVIFGYPRPSGRRRPAGYHVSLLSETAARLVRRPMLDDLRIDVVVKGESPEHIAPLIEQIHEWFEPTGEGEDRRGRTVFTRSAAVPVTVRLIGENSELSPSGDLWQTTLQLAVAGFPTFLGEAATVPVASEVETGTPESPVTA